MYSVVLVMALAGSAEAPDCNFFGFCGCMGNWNSCGCFGRSYGCGGCYGGCYGGGYGGCYGGCYGSAYGGQGMYYYGQPGTQVQPEKIADPKKKDTVPAPATMLVRVPPNTKLTVAGYESQQTTTKRTLVTPPIQPGQEFTYTLVAETTQNGQLVSQTREVTLRPGQFQPVTFNFAVAGVSSR